MGLDEHDAADQAAGALAAAGLQDTEQSQDLCSLQPLTSRCTAMLVHARFFVFPGYTYVRELCMVGLGMLTSRLGPNSSFT